MNKSVFSAAFFGAIAGMAVITGARAGEVSDFRPYVGIDLMRSVYSYNDDYDVGGGMALDGDAVLEDRLDGLGIHVGVRPHDNFGLEMGYFRTRNESRNIEAGSTVGSGTIVTADFKTKVRVQGVTLDGLGYLPLGEEEKFELIGTAGLSWSKAEIKIDDYGDHDSEFGFRIGAGGQYNIDAHFNLRGLIRYQRADFDDIADNAWTYSFGLNYAF